MARAIAWRPGRKIPAPDGPDHLDNSLQHFVASRQRVEDALRGSGVRCGGVPWATGSEEFPRSRLRDHGVEVIPIEDGHAEGTKRRPVGRRHRGRTVAVFGSVARGEESPTSDVDLLVEFEPGSSLFDLLHITQDFEALLGVPVDVVSTGGLKDRDDHIRREAIML